MRKLTVLMVAGVVCATVFGDVPGSIKTNRPLPSPPVGRACPEKEPAKNAAVNKAAITAR